jgi:hypothetical protein
MKSLIVSFILVSIGSTSLLAQHPIIGTWEASSLKGTDAGGEKFKWDTLNYREVKIITPTHYILIASDLEDDSLVFSRAYVGRVTLKGEKYIEDPILSSAPIFDNVKKDFTWKVNGGKFTQAGTFVRPDGKTVMLEELVFKRAASSVSFGENPSIGTWELISSKLTLPDGSSKISDNKTTRAIHIITPTHWMRVTTANNKFESAIGGIYLLRDEMTKASLKYASFPIKGNEQYEFTQKIEGNKLTLSGYSTAGNIAFEEIFQKLK